MQIRNLALIDSVGRGCSWVTKLCVDSKEERTRAICITGQKTKKIPILRRSLVSRKSRHHTIISLDTRRA